MKILVIRRDNIGDLVCTTPLLHTLRQHYPKAYLAVLANSYNAPLLEDHPDIDDLFIYTKSKHSPFLKKGLIVYLKRLRLILILRKIRFDVVILAGSTFVQHAMKTARLIAPSSIVGYPDPKGKAALKLPVPFMPDHSKRHEVEKTHHLLTGLKIHTPPSNLRIFIKKEEEDLAKQRLAAYRKDAKGPLLAIHLSSRIPNQRWTIEKYNILIQRLYQKIGAQSVLFWSPGKEKNRFHPGDDEKAKQLIEQLTAAKVPLFAFQTHHLRHLLAGLKQCCLYIGSDGGAMHIAAGLGLPCVALFGPTPTFTWYPWKVPHIILQSPSKPAADIEVEEVEKAALKLLRGC